MPLTLLPWTTTSSVPGPSADPAVEAAEITTEYEPIELELYQDDVEDARALDSGDDPALALFDKELA
jgi:hypothetical protein